jgi:hypothetical protein
MELQNEEIDMGVEQDGVRTLAKFDADGATVVKTWDAAPHLKHAENARIQTEGKGWGNGRLVGHIPPAIYAQVLLIKDKDERQAFLRNFLRTNPAFIMFDRYRKDLA